MSQTLLTSTIVTRKSLEILHNKLTFLGTINKQFDGKFGQEGAKIGSTLTIRLPNQYTVRTGQYASVQATAESSETLTIATQKGVDLNFSSNELTLSLDDFSERILEPAMAVLSANVESDALNMYKDVYNFTYETNYTTNPSTMATWLAAKAILYKNLTPKDTALNICANSASANATLAALSVLFHDGKSVAKQYLDGVMGHAMGFDWYTNEMIPSHTNGAATSFATGQVDGATESGATINVKNFTNGDIITKGSVLTFVGCYQVNPETKVTQSNLQQFVVTTTKTFSGTTGVLAISPSIVVSGAYQNVSTYPTDSGTIVIQGATSSVHPQNLAYHKNAFTFVTADLHMPKNMDMQARETYDGISLRFLRGFDILNDVFISRLDILYGYLTIRAQMACRVNAA
jgi:hypothetical protein